VRLILPAILLALTGCAFAEPDGITSPFEPGVGFTVTHRLTHPGTVAGTVIRAQATATYSSTDGRQGTAVSNVCEVTVGEGIYRQDTPVFIPTGFSMRVNQDSGSGILRFEGKRLTVIQEVPNDGAQHVFTWRMVPGP
jgi:hypothetical protein